MASLTNGSCHALKWAGGEDAPSTITASDFQTRTVVAGRFEIIRHLGSGAMGDVYESEDLQLRERVALKTLRHGVACKPEMVERFKREVLLGRRVTHPNVCRIYDFGFDRSEDGTGRPFFTMELLSGETLATRLKRRPTSENEALPVILDIVSALSAVHRLHMVHRDVKSGNVMLTTSGRQRAVLTDFGLSSIVNAKPKCGTTRDLTGIAGTIHYMAPEQIRGEDVTPATDIYGLGVVMYEMLTGQRPFAAPQHSEVLLKHLTQNPLPPSARAPWLPPKWDSVILTCLRKRPDERFRSAANLRTALLSLGPRRSRPKRGGLSGRVLTMQLLQRAPGGPRLLVEY